MLNKAISNIKDCINAIGIGEIVRSYVFAIFFLLILNWMGMFASSKGLVPYAIVCFVFFPFSVALYDLGMSFLFRGFFFANSMIIWGIWWFVKTMFLFFLSPILGIVFILVVTLTNATSKMIARYNENKELKSSTK